MASYTPTRRVLGDLNVNTPVGKSTMAGMAQKALQLEAGGENTALFSGKIQLAEGGENTTAQFGSEGKRGKGLLAIDDGEMAAKRRKIGHVEEAAEDDETHGFLSLSPQSSPFASPSSSVGNSTGDLNDTQNTILTLPDDFIYPPMIPQPLYTQPAPLRPEELRAKARAIRLRLSLASYKVRTNQIDVPISRLEVRSSSSQALPQMRRSTSMTSNPSSSSFFPSQHRTALPSAPASPLPCPPHRIVQQRMMQEADGNIPSSPPISISSSHPASAPVSPMKDPLQGVATPILPRQREGLLNPPLLSAEMESDLTSSVVKGRAADGLLCLMRMAE